MLSSSETDHIMPYLRQRKNFLRAVLVENLAVDGWPLLSLHDDEGALNSARARAGEVAVSCGGLLPPLMTQVEAIWRFATHKHHDHDVSKQERLRALTAMTQAGESRKRFTWLAPAREGCLTTHAPMSSMRLPRAGATREAAASGALWPRLRPMPSGGFQGWKPFIASRCCMTALLLLAQLLLEPLPVRCCACLFIESTQSRTQERT